MIKALMVAHYPLNPDNIKGGVEAVSVNLINGFLSVPGIDLKIFAINGQNKEDQVIRYSEHITIHHAGCGPVRSTKYRLFFHYRKQLRRLIKAYKPDVVHIQGNGSNLLLSCKIDKNNLVVTPHGILAEELKNQLTLRSKLNFLVNICIETLLMPRLRNFICISRYNAKILDRDDLPGCKTALIHNPVNPGFFNVRKNEKPVNRLIYIAGIKKLKGLLDLLEALKITADRRQHFRLEVVGGVVEPGYAKKVNDFIAANRLTGQVVFHNWLNQDAIIKLYNDVHILVLPSYQEVLPVCISEAMAAGRVVVAAKVGGVSEMITHRSSGFLYEKGNVPELAGILSELYLNAEYYHKISAQARKEAFKKYKPEKIAGQTLDFYKQVAGV
ncbi:glycosyltransferase family 4 protein [Pedobacter sp. BS3]|uniref:glycosyltransferase n=1 Tax=Pedobacter sp. BS3 TaxID=2567937 RepID=UPI0011ECBE7C|nr:glycosyltransferase [Pedobacter sp. BS3]TZF84450.1 glycosyltransferase family 4 protein [Pedobacter sp. BS3]